MTCAAIQPTALVACAHVPGRLIERATAKRIDREVEFGSPNAAHLRVSVIVIDGTWSAPVATP